ncbi:unnamed protein product [Polarella glacialis]|uniref:Uncharacterized protein n=1 Tax=Polarella glacialis TaxID=89957 RepID=A0A813L2H2_POLGL|nr:unnamed protein product [Polarella glacialis]CAE8721136.1 unnamed protein product [Polarella glacialis]|mmetsp:Transcript_3058/g.4770  ORF Transcript_3058/g.4770 Transcript_3058/m.4770 type:complete len:231 (-) Transcript_3058:51-743(-)
MTAEQDFDDPEEAAAWADMRAAFGEPQESEPTKPSTKGAGKSSKGGKGRTQQAVVKAPSGNAVSSSKAPSQKAPIPGGDGKPVRSQASAPAETPSEGADVSAQWLQSQVDRLTGELQRLSGGPFSPDLLKALWGLPLEDQQDVLLGVTGSEGSPLETRSETAVRLWRLTADEILARGGQVLPVRRVANSGAFRPPTGGATRSATGAVRGGRAPPTGGADRGRSRSRSPSI